MCHNGEGEVEVGFTAAQQSLGEFIVFGTWSYLKKY
jgi:hypothetical protein